jgi:hypothetical protein
MGRYALLAVAVAACYDPTTPLGVVCTLPAGVCPPGQTCGADGMCTTIGSVLADSRSAEDAPLDDAVKPDASSLPAWRLVQVKFAATSGSGNGSALAAMLTSTTAGDLLVVGVQFDPGTTITSVSDNAPAGTSAFLEVTSSVATNPQGDGSVEVWYTPSVNADATSVTATTTNGAVYTVVAWEVATTQPATVDVAKELSNQTASTVPGAPAVTTAKAGELVIATGISATTVTSIRAGNEFTNDSLANGNGWAHITSTTAAAGAHQAVWDSTSGTYCSDAVAFHVGE